MAISNDPSVLAGASRCFDTCIPPGDQPAVKTYLLAQLAGVTDPKVVANNARCFSSCIPPGMQVDVQAYLAAVLQGGSTDPSTLLNNATCFRSCVPPGASASVANYALANKAGGSTDPSTLANLARCFSSCIPPGMQSAAQSYLLGVQAGITDPAVAMTNARCFRCFDSTDPTIADALITSWAAGGGGPTPPVCPVPTGLAATANNDTTVTLTWNAVPAGVDYTEIWTSTDNVTFSLADEVAAPATTTLLPPQSTFPLYVEIRFCTGTIPNQFPLTTAWLAQVATNGGATPSALTRASLHQFESAISGLLTKLHHVNIVAPDSLIAAKTPFIHNYGNSLWTTIALGVPPAESITINGIKAATDGNNGNVYDLGFVPSAVASFNTGNCGCFAYYADASPGSSSFDAIGCYDGVSSAIGVQATNAGTNALAIAWTVAQLINVAHAQIGGLYMTSRTATNLLTLYFGNGSNAFASVATNVVNNAVSPNVTPDIGACGEIQPGPAPKPNQNRFSCFGVCDGLTLAEGQTLFNAIQNLRLALGGGFV